MSISVERFHKYTLNDFNSAFAIEFGGMKFTEENLDKMDNLFKSAAEGIAAIENGEIKNPDEQRKVTHFTDRASYADTALFAEVEAFAAKVLAGEILSPAKKKFNALVVNGIGGSALGPQLMQFAMNGPYWNELPESKRNGLKLYFLDNTDTAEFADLLAVMDLETTLHLVVSKSGGTKETKNNMIAMENYYSKNGVSFADCAVAITMLDSQLDKHAKANKWLAVFEMAESIGGRTSETSIVGHVPAALTGVDFKSFLEGACAMDEWTRALDYTANPAAMLATMWYIAGEGKGNRNMVIVPYSDRLVLLSRYLQQLVMESLGKELDLDGKVVHQGLNVFGNKGGTDAHAFIQQLNDGRDDFFATFIEVLRDKESIPLGDSLDMGDYLHGFLAGLSAALLNKGRQVITIRIPELNAFTLGQLIALYERAVAIYAEFIHINAFHQPGVQAYKLAADGILALRSELFTALAAKAPYEGSAAEIATLIGKADKEPEISALLDKAAFNMPNVSRIIGEQGNYVYRIK